MHKALKILYLGSSRGTSLDRANAYRRLGHQVQHIDLRHLLPATIWVDRIVWKMGGSVFTRLISKKLKMLLKQEHYDLCHIDSGEWESKSVIATLRKHAEIVINYNIDDPFSKRDGRRFHLYRSAVAAYDLCVVVREENIGEAYQAGAKNVMRVYRSADEVSHAERTINKEDNDVWGTDVLFLGTWMPERGGFLLELIKLDVPLSIRGANWHKAPEWEVLKPYYKGGELKGDDYAKAIQCAKVNIGLLSKGNRDLHTTRSAEIPALGGLFCAERTREHLAMYAEGKEALFWANAEECAEMCRFALADEARRKQIAASGKQRAYANKYMNEDVLQSIISHIGL